MNHFSDRLQILFLPYVLVTLLLGVGYTFLNWFFCINTQWVAINEMYIDFIIPMVITILLVYFVIRPRLHILQLAPGKDTFGIQMLIAISMFIPTAIAQNYIDKATYQIQPGSNGGNSLPDAIKAIKRVEQKIEKLSKRLDIVETHLTDPN